METDDDNVLSWSGERTNRVHPKSTADHFFSPRHDVVSKWANQHRLSIVALPY